MLTPTAAVLSLLQRLLYNLLWADCVGIGSLCWDTLAVSFHKP